MIAVMDEHKISRTGRGCHLLLDLDNLVGTPNPSREEVEQTMAQLKDLIPDFDRFAVTYACCHLAAKVAAPVLMGHRGFWRSGTDGADLALVDVIDADRLAHRSKETLICSGDGIFVDSVVALTSQGVRVTVVARAGSLNSRLRLAAHQVIELDDGYGQLGAVS